MSHCCDSSSPILGSATLMEKDFRKGVRIDSSGIYKVGDGISQIDVVDVETGEEARVDLQSGRPLQQVMINNVSGQAEDTTEGPTYVQACEKIIGVDGEGDFLLPPNTSAIFTFTLAGVWIALLHTTT